MTGKMMGITAIVISTIFESLGQLAFKKAADLKPSPIIGPPWSLWKLFVTVCWIFSGWIGFIADGILWSVALYCLDVSVAHPLGSLVFVVVAVFSRVLLREKVSAKRWAGIAFILGGTAVVAMS